MDDSPRNFILKTRLSEKKRRFLGFKHRFNTGDDIAVLCEVIAIVLRQHGSLEAFFATGFSQPHSSIKPALSQFVEGFLQLAAPLGDTGAFFSYLLPNPSSGSACKRLCMYLRWMVRPDDGIDCGVWHSVSTKHLIVPVDTHIAKQAQVLKLTSRRIPDWIMAEEITAALRNVDPQDPVKYDFSICRFGMLQNRS
jgi:uncharacterized protein (TIGR02757 family)